MSSARKSLTTPDLPWLRQSLLDLPRQEIETILADLPKRTIDVLRYDWQLFARDKQLAPPGDWRTWVPLAGRGWGKTRTGSEWIRQQVEGPTPLAAGKRRRLALIAETASDVRDVMVQGDSGILACTPKAYRPRYIASTRSLTWPNGAQALLYSAVEPDQLRGPQFDAAWCDELAKWRYAQDTWDMLQFGLRLGDGPQALVTTTPRPIKVLKDILADPSTVSTVSSTYENAGNLAEGFRDYVERKYAGTRLGRQELEAAILDDTPGALWSLAQIDALRVAKAPALRRIVVAVDPPATSGESADECGIVAAGITGAAKDPRSHGYILEDATTQGQTPRQWAETAVKLYHKTGADRLVAESNNGGEMVSEVIRQVDPNVNVQTVWASKGKVARAEPMSAIYEQERAHHVGTFAALEDQMTQFTIDGLLDGSPDRVDALVWALTALFEPKQRAAMVRSRR